MEFDLTLPVAGTIINPFFIGALGLMGGFLSGMFGVGGGVIITPTLIFMGIPPIVAVASQVNHSIGTCFTGFLGYHKNDDVDLKLGGYLLVGGFVGAISGVYLLKWLNDNGHATSSLTVGYIILLGIMGILLFQQSVKALIRHRQHLKIVPKSPDWVRVFPLQTYFPRTRVEMSIMLPIATGIINGLLTAAMGTGNGVFMMPALTYLIGRTSPVVYGTTLLAGLAITTTVTIMFVFGMHAVDLLLVFLLLSGGVLGSKLGVMFAYKIPRPYLGILGSFLIWGISIRLFFVLRETVNNPPSVERFGEFCLDQVNAFLPEFAQNCSTLIALAGVGGAILITVLVEFLFYRFSFSIQSDRR
jgi:uncharacterized membrane protein YfcA